MKLAIALEKKFTKEQILEGYLNIVFFNRDAYGIEAASKFFFSTTAKDLTLPQAALLAGLVNSPSAFDPITNPDNAKNRRDLVLSSMLSQGKITQADYDAAVATPVETKVTPARQGCAYSTTAPYFCDYVLHLLLNNPAYGADANEREKQDLPRRPDHQDHPGPQGPERRRRTRWTRSAGANPDKWGAALVSVQPNTGKITNMAQNTVVVRRQRASSTRQLNFNVDQYDEDGNDLNGLGGAQPGSTMKPFTFAEWLNEGKSMNTIVNARLAQVPAELPVAEHLRHDHRGCTTRSNGDSAQQDLQNAEEGYYRSMTVLDGLTTPSTRPPSPRPPSLTSAASRRSWTPWDSTQACPTRDDTETNAVMDPNPKINMSTTGNLLGSTQTAPLTMASAFATFANDGKYCEPDRHHLGDGPDRRAASGPVHATAGTPSSPRWPAA